MIKLEQYGNKNFRKLIINENILWFSYETLIAFKPYDYVETFIAKNEWSNTTGKHLGIIKRETQEYMEIKYDELIRFAEEFYFI